MSAFPPAAAGVPMDGEGDPGVEGISQAVSDAVQGLGLVVEAVETGGSSELPLLRVVLDLAEDADGELDLDRLAEASQAVNQVVESHPATSGPFELEVASPGAERSLTLPRHWKRAVGRLVELRLQDGRQLTARIREAGGEAATVECEVRYEKGRKVRPAVEGPFTVEYASVLAARVVVEN